MAFNVTRAGMAATAAALSANNTRLVRPLTEDQDIRPVPKVTRNNPSINRYQTLLELYRRSFPQLKALIASSQARNPAPKPMIARPSLPKAPFQTGMPAGRASFSKGVTPARLAKFPIFA